MTDQTDLVSGHVSPGFEQVREVFAAGHAKGYGRGGGGLAAYVDGKEVVNLWAGLAGPGKPWQSDTRACIASVTKAWAAAVIWLLVEQGKLDFESPIATWWPEFAQAGKDRITIPQIMLHTAGVVSFDGQDKLFRNDSGWGDQDAIAAGYAAQAPAWEPGTMRGYHAVSYGWILAEIVRRVSDRTMGEIFRTAFAEPLKLDCSLGTQGADLARVCDVWTIKESEMSLPVRLLFGGLLRHGRDERNLSGKAFLAYDGQNILDRVEALMKQPGFMAAEMPASNGTATVQSLARFTAMLAGGGELDGVRVLKTETVAEMRKTRAIARDEMMAEGMPRLLRRLGKNGVPLALGFGTNQKPTPKSKTLLGPNEETFGAGGFGGQLIFADPVANLGVGYVRNDFVMAKDPFKDKLVETLYSLV